MAKHIMSEMVDSLGIILQEDCTVDKLRKSSKI